MLIVFTLAFIGVLMPFYGAVFWGIVLAILFAPMQRWLLTKTRQRPTPAALLTLGVIVLIVIIPLLLITAALIREGALLYSRMQSGEINFARYYEQTMAALPGWATNALDLVGLGDTVAWRDKITAALTQGSQQIASRALDIGSNTLDLIVSFFITLYLAFFLIRDGEALARHIEHVVPLDPATKRPLFAKFTIVIRATVKGNVLVAAAQGALGGIAFWFLGVHAAILWAVLMAFLSLLPAIGAALIWVPVALYFLATGAVVKGLGLIAFGTFVIGLVDNVLRPLLVGRDTQMPDYLVLMSTLGGMAIFGLNGFVIGPVIAAMFIAVWDQFGHRAPAPST